MVQSTIHDANLRHDFFPPRRSQNPTIPTTTEKPEMSDDDNVFSFDLHDESISSLTSKLDLSSAPVDIQITPPKMIKTSSSFTHRSAVLFNLIHQIEEDSDQVVDIHNFSADSNNNQNVSLGSFSLLKVIGKGAYGKVFLVKRIYSIHLLEQETSNFYAMKVLKKASIVVHGKEKEHTMNERSILEAVRHPFIVKLYFAFQTPSKLYLILSYASGGELFSYLAKERMFLDDQACFYISEILLALEHLHTLGIIYRDLKPENVLLDSEGHVTTADF